MQTRRIPHVFAAFALLVAAAPARAATINFEEFNEGDIVSSITVDGSNVTVSGVNPAFPGQNAAMIFDSACPGGCSGSDPDLGTPNEDFGGPGIGAGGNLGSPNQNDSALGKMLIISEDLDAADPDDADNVGESITFDFSAFGTVTLSSMNLVDVEAVEPNAVIELRDAADAIIATIVADPTGDNGVDTVGLGPTAGVAKMIVTLNGSGAIDNIVFDADAVCGNDTQEEGEECDGTDDAACGLAVCKSDCTCEEEEGGEGCTPGYWKQRQHLDSWQGVAPGDNFNTTFGTNAVFSEKQCGTTNPTLLEALRCEGGCLSAIARHGVAALLNALSNGVSYDISADAVKDAVKDAIATGDCVAINDVKDDLAGENEQGCPLN